MASADDYAAWLVKNRERKGTPEFDKVAKAYQLAKIADERPTATAGDRAQAAAAGVNRGALSALPGFPVDTALNVWDLLKAGAGAVGGATGLVKPENLPQLTDRATIPGSSEWFAQKERGIGMGKVIDPNRPDDPTSRVLHAAGVGVGAAPMPAGGVAQAFRNAAQVAAAGGMAQGTVEAGHPEWAAVAGMAPFAPGAFTGSNKPSLLTPEQQAIRQRAVELGYELTPGQMTGKRWQQNVEAAMREAPSTSGRMQQIDARNMQLTNRLVAEAQESVGGPIDQGTAGAAALKGMREGIAREADRTGAAYKDLLVDVPVNLEAQRGRLEALRKRQASYPEDQRGGSAGAALDNLLGTPGYAAKTRKGPAKIGLDVQRDDIVAAVRKRGGMTPDDEAVGSLAKSLPFENNPALGPVWRKQQFGGQGNRTNTVAGHSLEEMTRMLHEDGYVSSPNAFDEVIDKLADQSRGVNQHFSVYREPPSQDPLTNTLADVAAALKAQTDARNRAPEAKPGFMRENPEISGPVAQDLRSAYGSAAESAFAGGKNRQGEVYRELKVAVDNAIESSLPKEKQSQFAALNKKYGYDMAIKAMNPESQEAFLAQLYRGAPDQFYTFLGVVDPKSFKATSRGFVSDLLNTVTNKETGNIKAAALGREIAKLDPGTSGRADVMKYFGGKAAPVLRDVGAIGAGIIPDPVANSGTAQRLWYQSLLRGGGIAGGGTVGGLLGGVPGAVVGTVLGDFVVPKAIQSAYLSKTVRDRLTKQGKREAFGPDEDLLRRYGGLLGYSAALNQ